MDWNAAALGRDKTSTLTTIEAENALIIWIQVTRATNWLVAYCIFYLCVITPLGLLFCLATLRLKTALKPSIDRLLKQSRFTIPYEETSFYPAAPELENGNQTSDGFQRGVALR